MNIKEILGELNENTFRKSTNKIKDFIKGSNKGVSLDPTFIEPGDDSAHGDVRDLAAANKIGSFSRKKMNSPGTVTPNKNSSTSTKVADINNPQHRNKPTTWKPVVYEFINLLKSKCEDSGYTVDFLQEYHGIKAGITTKVNNINIGFALNAGKNLPATFTIGVPKGNSPEDTQEKSKDLLDGLTDAGFKWYIGENKRISINVPNKNPQEIIDKFLEVVSSVEDMGEDFKTTKTLSKVASKLQRKQAPFRYYLGAASLIYVAVKFNLPNVLPRGGGEKSTSTFDINDNLLAQGYSESAAELMKSGRGTWDKKNNDGIWREHPVPCDLIIKKAVDMIKARRTGKLIDEEIIGEVAKMIQRNLMIVWITKDEADKLDNELGLKTTMPQGDSWDPFKDDPLSRLKVGGIRVYSADAGARLRETK